MSERFTIIVLGSAFIICGYLNQSGSIESLSEAGIFGLTLGGLLLAIASTIDDPLSGFKNRKLTVHIVAKSFFYTLGILSIVLIPLLGDSNNLVKWLTTHISSETMLFYCLGLSFITFAISDFNKKQLLRKFSIEKENAISDTKIEIVEGIENKFKAK